MFVDMILSCTLFQPKHKKKIITQNNAGIEKKKSEEISQDKSI